MDKIRLEGMEFSGRHGCFPGEREQSQPFIVDVYLSLDLGEAGRMDNLAATVDYATVYDIVRVIIEGKSVDLIETLAERIASAILSKYPKVRKVEVAVHKPKAPMSGKFRDASVLITRMRS